MITNVTAKANYNNYNLGFKGAKDKPIMTLKDKLKFVVGDTFSFGTKKGEKIGNKQSIEMTKKFLEMSPEERKEVIAQQMLSTGSIENSTLTTNLHASHLPKTSTIKK